MPQQPSGELGRVPAGELGLVNQVMRAVVSYDTNLPAGSRLRSLAGTGEGDAITAAFDQLVEANQSRYLNLEMDLNRALYFAYAWPHVYGSEVHAENATAVDLLASVPAEERESVSRLYSLILLSRVPEVPTDQSEERFGEFTLLPTPEGLIIEEAHLLSELQGLDTSLSWDSLMAAIVDGRVRVGAGDINIPPATPPNAA